MKLLIILFITVISLNLSANTLTFSKDGKVIKSFKMTEIKTGELLGVKEQRVKLYNAWRGYTKTYVGYDYYMLLDKIYSKDWRKAKMIITKALDGYTMGIEVQKMIDASSGKVGIISYKESDREGFTPFKRNEKNVDPGPFYLLWSNFSDGDKATHGDALKWPYQLKDINIEF